MMEFKLLEKRANIFKHYLFRWIMVPRPWQRGIRYFILGLTLVLAAAYLFWPALFLDRPSLNVSLIVLALYLAMTIVNAALYTLRTKPEPYLLAIGETNFRCETPSQAGTVELDGIKSILIRPSYIRVTLASNSFDTYFYVFKDEAIEGNFETIQREFGRLRELIAASEQ